jgi:hypothetical protein
MNKGLLDEIVHEINHSIYRKYDFWLVVSALRGPDKDEFVPEFSTSVKSATTAVIRYKLGVVSSPLDVNEDTEDRVELRKALLYGPLYDRVGGHFILHARNAFGALGLKWGELNT